ncbi:tail protein X [Blastochloris tepida]|uniref:Tail protein X n=1 Tax=Blastochloris tepida TaxID=2233851 RepID=A0A348FYG1_9HYPH|nr:tail protein X [Blastochloris tepida]BBF92344.1 tail protein X [Blastochloris tepida]
MKTYITVDGDMVDRIAWQQLGTSETTTEALLEANPGLEARGPVLPAGLVLTIPDGAAPPVGRTALKLWD